MAFYGGPLSAKQLCKIKYTFAKPNTRLQNTIHVCKSEYVFAKSNPRLQKCKSEYVNAKSNTRLQNRIYTFAKSNTRLQNWILQTRIAFSKRVCILQTCIDFVKLFCTNGTRYLCVHEVILCVAIRVRYFVPIIRHHLRILGRQLM